METGLAGSLGVCRANLMRVALLGLSRWVFSSKERGYLVWMESWAKPGRFRVFLREERRGGSRTAEPWARGVRRPKNKTNSHDIAADVTRHHENGGLDWMEIRGRLG